MMDVLISTPKSGGWLVSYVEHAVAVERVLVIKTVAIDEHLEISYRCISLLVVPITEALEFV